VGIFCSSVGEYHPLQHISQLFVFPGKYLTLMKKITFPLLFLVCCATLTAQVQGNFKSRARDYDKQESRGNISQSNYVPNDIGQQQAFGSRSAAYIAGDNVVEFRVNALSNQRASSYTAIFNVIQLGKTADETNTALKNRLDPLLAELRGLGLKNEDIYLDMVNFLPKFEYDVSKKLFSKKTYTEIPIGFELQKNIHVRFADPAVLDQVVAAAAKYEIYDIVKVDYFVKDSRAVYAQMRSNAISYLKDIRAAYAGVLPLDSAYVVTAENTLVAYPGDRYKSYQAFSCQSLDPSQRADAKVERVDKPVSQFYDAIAANDYDVVINPEILEPCVQFSLNMVVRFTLKERVPAVKLDRQKEFILVTPTGEVKTLKID
jgi:uncharacterized protein YggE